MKRNLKNDSKKRLLTFIFLFLFLGAAIFILQKDTYSKQIPVNFQLQDSTRIQAGKMVLKVWDYSIIDSDIVNIIFDGKKIFKDLLLTSEQKIYNAGFVDTGRHWIGIDALSEGSIGAATTHISLSNEKQQFEFDIEAHKNKPAYRLIIVQ